MASAQAEAPTGSQTLSRGLAALALIGETRSPLSINEIAEHLGINRSAAYRIVRTLEQHRFARRTASGVVEPGVRLAAFGQSAYRALQSAALPQLQSVADDLAMTAFLVVYDGVDVVTLLSVEPRNAVTYVAQRPGRRQAVGTGAPGQVIRSQLQPEAYPSNRFEITHDEVIPGLTAIAVPVPGEHPASIAVLFATRSVDVEEIVTALEGASDRMVGGES